MCKLSRTKYSWENEDVAKGKGLTNLGWKIGRIKRIDMFRFPQSMCETISLKYIP